MSQDSLDSTTSVLTLTPTTSEILHFAYAEPSTALLRLSPSSLPVGLARLPGFAFALNASGRANIVAAAQTDNLLAVPGQGSQRATGECVYGLLYLLPETDEVRLDAAQDGYKKTIQEVELLPPPGERERELTEAQLVRALVYLDPEDGQPGKLAPEHGAAVRDMVTEAEAEAWGMPAWYAERVRKCLSRTEPGTGAPRGAAEKTAVAEK